VFLFGHINEYGSFVCFTSNGQGYVTSGGGSGATANDDWSIVENGFVVAKRYNWTNESGKTNTYLAIG
jgi:hypothetical protein